MTSAHNDNEDRDSLRRAAINGHWYKVLDMYEDKRELRLAKITKGDTVLHMAVSSGKEYVVEFMVDIVCGAPTNEQDETSTSSVCEEKTKKHDEKSPSLPPPVDENGNEKKDVLGAINDQGNTPLHLAASKGNVRMCKKIGGKDSSLITLRNRAGETPLFLAAFHGHIKAFLWLHYQYTGSPGRVSQTDIAHCIKRDNDDTILHCALEGEHIDVAIEIVFLYKDHLKEMMMMRNKNGLSPLHILAVTPSAFKSIDLPNRSYVVQLLYLRCFGVKEKEEATKKEELEQRERESCIRSCIEFLVDPYYECLYAIYDGGSSWVAKIRVLISYSLGYLFMILLFPLFALEYLFTAAGKWFHGIRNMKEKHTWSLQIMEKLLPVDSYELLFKKPYKEKCEAGFKIVDTPLMIAAKNGLIEMLKKILETFPSTMNDMNDEGKNIVLLAAEKRQTKLYQTLWGNEYYDKSLFSQADKDGNTALHLAAKFGVNLDMQATTMVEEFKWFEFVERSVPSELRERYNKDGKTAKEIFWDSYKEHMKSDRKWLNQTSQTCSVASTLVASMAFSNIVEDNFDKKNIPSLLLALSLSLTSTISFLAILAFRSQSLKFWKYAPFMIQIAILTMFGSIVALWISLMLNGHSLTTYAILGTPIAILTIVSLPIFIGPSLMSLFTKIPPPSRKTTSAIYYQMPQKKEAATDSNSQKKEAATDSNPQKEENAIDSNPHRQENAADSNPQKEEIAADSKPQKEENAADSNPQIEKIATDSNPQN